MFVQILLKSEVIMTKNTLIYENIRKIIKMIEKSSRMSISEEGKILVASNIEV